MIAEKENMIKEGESKARLDLNQNGAKHSAKINVTHPKNINWKKALSKKTPESSFLNESFYLEFSSNIEENMKQEELI